MKTIMVTGASGDIGACIVSHLRREGYDVIAVIHDAARGATTPALAGIETYITDISMPTEVAALAKAITRPISWIVAAHGYMSTELDFMKMSTDEVAQTFAINTFSILSLTKFFLPTLEKGLVVISSTAGLSANGKVAAYSASKAAVNSLVQGFARNKSEHTFLALCPGPTKGKMREKIGAEGGQDPSLVADALLALIAENGEYKSGDIVSVKDGVRTLELHI